MGVDCFLDTNVLVYTVSSLPEEAEKKDRALDLVRHADFGLSTQVLQEFYVTVTRKIRRPLPAATAAELLDAYRVFPLALTDYPLVIAGVERSLEFGISYWDGAILAAAEALGAKILYTEDLSDGQRYGTVEARNPFAG